MAFIKDNYPQLWAYFDKSESLFIDFSFCDDNPERLKGFVPDVLIPYFTLIGRSENGSLICLWQFKPDLDKQQQPIVYLDSENYFHSVIAANVLQFLTLLPYSMGGICQMLYSWKRYLQQPEEYDLPLKRHNSRALKTLTKQIAENYPDYDEFVSWLVSNEQIEPSVTPARLIKENMDAYPNLTDWLKTESSEP